MHRELDININNLSKIEGHTDLEIRVKNGKVEKVELKIVENRRFFEHAIKNKHYLQLAQMVSRICGTCSIAHILCAIEAIENALDYKPSNQTTLLRKALMYGLYLRDHALHLYLFTLPDLYNKDSLLEFDDDDPEQQQHVEDAFDIKRAGNNLSTLIGGRSVHAPLPMVGGFPKIPTKEEIAKVIAELKSIRPQVERCIKVYNDCEFNFERNTHFVGLTNEDFNFLEGKICSTKGLCIPEKEMGKYLQEKVIPYSQAKGYTVGEKDYMVGALARINQNSKALHPNTKKTAAEALKKFPSNNIYHNNLAQAIEILHSLDASLEILENNEFKAEPMDRVTPKESEGVGVIEAPRGTLYYYLILNAEGKITGGDIVVPTAQNQINIENDIKQFVQDNIDMKKNTMQFEIEKLIRAYDPCMSCAAHFLKLKIIKT